MTESNGGLRIRTYTAGGALPVEGAIVRIVGADENNDTLAYSLVTDRDGQTPLITLPAPDADYSLSPDPGEAPYSTWDIVITAPGYLTKRIDGLTVFSGVNSIQLINMIPGMDDGYDDKPNGNLDLTIPDLELN